MNLKENKNLHSSARKYSHEFQKTQKTNSTKFKDMILTDRRISDMEIVNKNLQKKLSLFEQKKINVKKQEKQESFRPMQSFIANRSIVYNPLGRRPEGKQKFTNYEQKIMEEYQTQVKENQESGITNPFQLALLQMIEKQKEMLDKRQKDLKFWQDRVKTLESKYKELQKNE